MEPEDEDVDWLVSEVHMVHEVPASSGDVAGELYLSRFPLYTDVGAVDGEKEPQDADDDEAGVDEEGDLVVPRRRAVSTGDERRRQVTGVVTLLHALRTTLPAVGLQVRTRPHTHTKQHAHTHALTMSAQQVWRGSLVLADYIMREQDAGRWHDVHALELGAGAGLAGLIMARHASRVWFTGNHTAPYSGVCRVVCGNRDTHRVRAVRSIESDYDDEVLANCEKNGQLNRHLFAHEDVVRVRKLDWLAPPPAWFRASPTNAAEPAVRPAADHSGDEAAGPPYEWTQADVAECQRISVLLAADGESAAALTPCSTSPSLSLRVSCHACRAACVVSTCSDLRRPPHHCSLRLARVLLSSHHCRGVGSAGP